MCTPPPVGPKTFPLNLLLYIIMSLFPPLSHSWLVLYFGAFLPSLGFLWFLSTQISFHLTTLLLYGSTVYIASREWSRAWRTPLLIGLVHGLLHYFYVYDIDTIENHSFTDLLLHTTMLVYAHRCRTSDEQVHPRLTLVYMMSLLLSLASIFLFRVRHTYALVFQLFRLSAFGHALSSGLYVAHLLGRHLASTCKDRASQIYILHRTHLTIAIVSYIVMMCFPTAAVYWSGRGRYYETFFIIPCLLGATLQHLEQLQQRQNNYNNDNPCATFRAWVDGKLVERNARTSGKATTNSRRIIE